MMCDEDATFLPGQRPLRYVAIRGRRRKVDCMTSQEEQLLNGLIQRVQQTQLQEKDNEAELLLQRSLAQNPEQPRRMR